MASETKDRQDSLPRGVIVKRDRSGRDILYARIVRIDGSGKKRQFLAKAKNRTEAKQLVKKLESKYSAGGAAAISGDRMTFRDVARRYKERKLIPAEFHGTGEGRRKIAGLKSLKGPTGYLNTLVNHFGARFLRDITHADVEDFKLSRLRQPVGTNRPRAVASVNRELELLRAVLRFAKRQRWIQTSPFEEGHPLISKADESRRERTLSYAEEDLLLAACTDRRAHLRPILICAIDTGMRRGEIFKLEQRDIDLIGGTVTVRAQNSKTDRKRVIPIMTPRLRVELENLIAALPGDPNVRVFGISDTIKTSFGNARAAAGISDFRFHDCRHTATTRMIAAGIPATEVMKITGHTQITTFLRYLNPTDQSRTRAAELLAGYNERRGNLVASDFVN